MTKSGGAGGPISATELIAQLEDDAEYQARKKIVDHDRARRVAADRESEAPLVADLNALGVNVDSVWEMHKLDDAIPTAVPVLLDHIQRAYPSGVITGIGVALQNLKARPFWSAIRDVYLRTNDDVVRDELAAALSVCATRDSYGELVRFIQDASLGESRLLFLRPIYRIGNRMGSQQGRTVVESVVNDPIFHREATAILKGRGPAD